MISVMKKIHKVDYERQLNSLQDLANKKGKSAAIFNLRDSIFGGKKTCQEQVALIDPASGKEVTTPAEIKKVSLEYCVNLLRKRVPENEFKELILNKKWIHEQRME